MRRYLLVSGDFVKTGGMDRANYALASYLAGRGDDVGLVAYRAGEDLLAHSNVSLRRVPKPLGSYLIGHPVLSRAGRRQAAQVAGAGARVVVNGGNCRWGDVNWLHHLNVLDPPRSSGPWTRRAWRHLGYRVYVREDRAALRMARLVITTCERNKRDLIDWLGIPDDRVRVVYYGTDPDAFRPADPAERDETRRRLGWPSDRPVLAFIGALGDRRKGFDTLFGAWRALCKRASWDADLVVIGDGAERPDWERRARDAGLATRLRFLGFRRDVPTLIRACDAHVLPSRYEGYSLVTQEALCCGLPAFVTEVAGIAERYPDGLRPLLIPDPDDDADLARRLTDWRDRSAEMAAAVASFSERLRAETWDRMASRFADIVDAS